MPSKHLFPLFALLAIQISLGVSQYPENLFITGLPNQNSSINAGWMVGDTDSQSFYYYNLYTKEGGDINVNSTETPLIIYLEGGPGQPATMTAFAEVGPLNATSAEDCSRNENAWTNDFHLLMIDNPIGTGFSLQKNGYSVGSTDKTVDNLITFLTRFMLLFPSVKVMPIYIYGRSYGAKWASALASKWMQTPELQDIPLKGLILANAIVDPTLQNTTAESVDSAFSAYLEKISADEFISPAGSVYRTHFMVTEDFAYDIGSNSTQQLDDFDSSAQDVVEYDLGQELDTLIFTGELDEVVTYDGMMNLVQALEWQGKEAPGPTQNLTVDGSVAGTYHKQGNLVVAEVNEAGHYASYDKPASVAALLKDFINGNL